MKKVILLFNVIISLAISALAEDTTGVYMDFYTIGNEESSTQLNRSLVQVPTIYVVYTSDTRTIRITSSEPSKANIYIYDCNGNVVSFTNSLNAVIQLPSSGSYTIYIEGDGWYGIGYVNTSIS